MTLTEPEPEPEQFTPSPQDYFVEGGRRYVRPFDFEYRVNLKAKWVGRTLLDIFDAEFPFQPANFHERAIERCRLVARSNDGQLLPPANRLKLGDTITHVSHTHEPSVCEPAVQLIGHDEHVVVVCKGASLPVHSCGRFRRNTVIHILEACFGFGALRTVHRLDRVTSGVVILARSKEAARCLSEQIKAKVLRKEYLALVTGEFPLAPAADANSADGVSASADSVAGGYMRCDAPLAQQRLEAAC